MMTTILQITERKEIPVHAPLTAAREAKIARILAQATDDTEADELMADMPPLAVIGTREIVLIGSGMTATGEFHGWFSQGSWRLMWRKNRHWDWNGDAKVAGQGKAESVDDAMVAMQAAAACVCSLNPPWGQEYISGPVGRSNDGRWMMKYAIEKRVANTESWGNVGYADSRENAIEHARGVLGGASTGVRIRKLDPAEDYPGTVEMVVGSEQPIM